MISIQNQIVAQNILVECSTECNIDTNSSYQPMKSAVNSSKEKYYDYYNTSQLMWIPQTESGVKTIKINFVIVQRYANDPQNFSKNGIRSDGTHDDDYLRTLVTLINQLYANLADPSDNGGQEICGSCNQVKDTKIQFELVDIHYIVDSIRWGNTNVYYKFNPSNEINIYIPNTTLNYSWCSGYSSGNLNSDIYLVMNSYYNWYVNGWNDYWIGQFAHELGHALGLCHLYFGGGCATTIEGIKNSGGYFDDHYGTYPGRCPDIGIWNSNPYLSNNDFITNNLMGGTTTENYWTPKQIGVMHRNLSFNNTRKYLKNTVHNPYSIIVNSEEVWNFDWLLDRDIQIDNLGKIVLSSNIQMPNNGKIIINSGGQMVVNNSSVTNPIEDNWGGITVKSGGLLVINTTAIHDYSITVEPGGTIVVQGSLSISGNHSITINSGGYYCLESGTEIALSDYNSVIKLEDGSLNGINPSLITDYTCLSNPTNLIVTGNGSIIDYVQDVYIQNIIINANRYIGGKNIYVGNHVTTSQIQGDVLINNGANVIFDCKEITFDSGFECDAGSTFEVINH